MAADGGNAANVIRLSKNAQEGVVQFHKACLNMFIGTWEIRNMMERIDLDYMREGNRGADDYQSMLANLRGDKSKMRDPIVPVIYPQVETATAYLSGAFLTGYPMFGVAADPTQVNEALQMETLIADQQMKGAWVREFMMFFRDGLKYNLQGLEVCWDKQVSYELTQDASYKEGREAMPKRTIWEGNYIKRLDMYNTFFDTRVLPSQLSKKGEFGGYIELKSRIALKQYINDLPDEGKLIDNITKAFESGPGAAPFDWYYIPSLNPEILSNLDPRMSTNWLAWASLEAKDGIRYQDMYQVSVIYGRIIPSDFNISVPFKNHPQIWKFIIINNSVLVYYERLTNAHNMLPIMLGQPLEDGLGFQTKSFAQNVKPYQDISTALWAAKMNSERRRVMDRIFYDPNRIRAVDINDANPIGRIPVKASAYNKNIKEAFDIAPFQDSNSQFFVQTAQLVVEMAQQTNGMNRPIEGQFQKGNKTKTEFQTIMGNANARLQTLALFVEAQVMTPLKEMLKTNILQYQGPTQVYNIDQQQLVKVDPVALRQKVMAFQMADGLLPTEKILSTDFMGMVMQVMSASPQMQMEYDVMGLFSYWAKNKGMKYLDSFKRTPQGQQDYINKTRQLNTPVPPPPEPESQA